MFLCNKEHLFSWRGHKLGFDFLQALEQMQAMLRDLSPVLWSYKENLKKQGFTEEQAMDLAKELQKNIITQK
jgi:hypothetical protein